MRDEMRHEKDPQTEFQRFIRTPKLGTCFSNVNILVTIICICIFLKYDIPDYFINRKINK